MHNQKISMLQMNSLLDREEKKINVDSTTIKYLSIIEFNKTLSYLCFNWVLIFATLSMYAWKQNFYMTLATIFILSSRQHALLALMHEAAHQRLSNDKKINELLSDWFCAFPLFIQTNAYREHHLKHHRHLNTTQDPDWARKHTLDAWSYPMNKTKFTWYHLRYLLGYGLLEWGQLVYKFSGFYKKDYSDPSIKKAMMVRFIYYSTVAFILTMTKTWDLFAIWTLTYFFPFQIFQRLRSTAEHFGLPRNREVNQTRNVFAPAWENALFAPHHLNYHLVHHMFPSVPFYNLPKMHQALMQFDEYKNYAHENDSYISPWSKKSLLKDLIKINHQKNVSLSKEETDSRALTLESQA